MLVFICQGKSMQGVQIFSHQPTEYLLGEDDIVRNKITQSNNNETKLHEIVLPGLTNKCNINIYFISY